jgi:hypothetical protein
MNILIFVILIFFYRRKNEEKKTLIDKKNNSISDENRIQEKINKEQINLGSYQNEEKQYQNNMQKQSTKITEIAREMETICKY